jgi:8-oxo-dGTP diphosphatase
VYNRDVSKSKQLLSKLWKLIPHGLRWRTIWAVSPRFVVVFNDRDEVLLARHVFREERPWGPPGGIVHNGEGLPEALRREVREETGLEVAVGPLVQVGIGTAWPHLSFHFLCTIQGSTEIRVSGELFEAGFYALDALPGKMEPEQLDMLAYALYVSKQPEPTWTARIIESEAQ